MISVSNLAKSFGDQVLFEGASFQLNPGERYGLIGANGSGKTTLLNILSGDLDPSGGSVSIPSRVNLGVLRQDQFLHEEDTVIAVAMMGNPELWRAIQEKDRILANAADHFDADAYARVEETFERHDGYAAEARAAEILEGLGLPAEVHHRPLSTLSGGFKLRVLLAQSLAGSPDALLLDEPTNHLDILSIRWLEKFLKDFAGPVVVISHDHRFLDNVVTHILDVDYRTVTLYHGNYSRFQEAKQEERERREKEIASRQKEIAHHQHFVDRFRAKASKARQAQSKLRLIEKKAEGLEALPQSSRRYPSFRFAQARHSGREVLELTGIRKSFGENRVLHGVDLTVQRGDRLAIMGPNGIGKSTLLKIVVGELEQDDGDVEWGYETRPGYFAQDHHESLDEVDRTAEQWIADFCPGQSRGFVRGELGRVLFSGDEAEKPVSALSGGEAARLVFCRLAIERPNVLVLDEPTNHLDLESIEALVEALEDYDGTLVFVSHDRWFVSRLANRIVEIRADGIQDYRGTYEEYVHDCGDDHLDVDTVVLAAKKEKRGKKTRAGADGRGGGQATGRRQGNGRRSGAGRSSASGEGESAGRGAASGGTGGGPRKLSRYELARLEERREAVTARIAEIEARIAEIDEAFCDPSIYEGGAAGEVQSLEEERNRLKGEMEGLLGEWESVESRLEARGPD